MVTPRPCYRGTKPYLLTANSFGDRSSPRLRRPDSYEDRTSPRVLQSCPDEYSSSPCRRRRRSYGVAKVYSGVQGAHMKHAAGQRQFADGPPFEGMTMSPGALHGPCDPQLDGTIHTLLSLRARQGVAIRSPHFLSLRGRSRRELTWQSSLRRYAGCGGDAVGCPNGRWIAASLRSSQ